MHNKTPPTSSAIIATANFAGNIAWAVPGKAITLAGSIRIQVDECKQLPHFNGSAFASILAVMMSGQPQIWVARECVVMSSGSAQSEGHTAAQPDSSVNVDRNDAESTRHTPAPAATSGGPVSMSFGQRKAPSKPARAPYAAPRPPQPVGSGTTTASQATARATASSPAQQPLALSPAPTQAAAPKAAQGGFGVSRIAAPEGAIVGNPDESQQSARGTFNGPGRTEMMRSFGLLDPNDPDFTQDIPF